MKPTATLELSSRKDGADKTDGGTGAMLWASRMCYVVVVATALWAVASVLFPPSPFSLPLTSSVTVSQHHSHRQPSQALAPPAEDSRTVTGDRCEGRYIYVYDDLPPRFNDDVMRGCRALRPWMDMCPYMPNCGLGRPLGEEGGVFPGRGWYATDQFMLDVIFRCRMRRYECLTADPGLAAALFVPAYASLDGGRYLWNSTATRDALAQDLVAWLARRPEWRAMGGRDHFLVAGRTAWDFLRKTDDDDADWGTKMLRIPAVRNMTALVLEIDPGNQSTTLAVPYPTYFHPETAADVRAWQEKARAAERGWLFSFAGAARPGSKKTVRAEIFQQCGASRRCGMFRCTKGSECESSPAATMRLFESSSFCLQPRGDTTTRKSTFDAVIAGCIPVFFHPDSAYTQYAAHLPADPERWSVLIMHTDVTDRNVSIEETLSKIPPVTVKAMREEVIRLIPRLVYADPRSRRQDFKDAFDIAVEVVLDRVAKRRRGDVEGR